MVKWEYAMQPIHLLEEYGTEPPTLVDPMEYVKKLGELGEQGWELVSVLPLTNIRAGGSTVTFTTLAFLKRPIV